MKISKRQLRKIIAEEKAKIQEQFNTGAANHVYNDVNERVIAMAEDILNDYGSDDDILEAITSALTDAAQTIMTDASLMR